MILGKDKDRVRNLEIECKLAMELLSAIRSDLITVREAVVDDIGVEKTIEWPYMQISYDIGRCDGLIQHLDDILD